MEAPLTEKFSHYEIYGSVKIETWDGTTGMVDMNPVYLNEENQEILNDHRNCAKYVNDGGFGCKAYLAGIFDVWKVYEHGGRIHWYDVALNLVNPSKPMNEKDKVILENFRCDG